VYEAAAQTRRTVGWRAPSTSPNLSVLSNLATLRDRSRQAVRNDGWAKGTLDKLVTNIIGTGIKPLSKAEDPEFRRAVQALWLRWTDESDADGLLDFYGQQAQAVRTWLEAGEVFVRLRPRLVSDGLSVPLQVQVIEPELCPYTLNRALPSGNRVRAGVEFNGIGKRVAYWFHPSRPGAEQDWDENQVRRVPADQVLHIYDPLRAGQIRGLPHLTQALVRLYELDKFEDAVLLRSQIANLFAGFLKRPTSEGSDLHPLTGLAPDGTTDSGRPMLSLEPGTFQELGPGEEVQFNNPPMADPFGPAFMKGQLMAVSAATGVPYEVLTGDMSGLNDRVMRVVLHEFRRQIQGRQHHIVAFQLCRPVWAAWMDRAFLAGALVIPAAAYEADPQAWAAVKWMPQGWPYLHPVQDVQAAQSAIRAGFTSRSAVVSEQGEDAEQIDAEQADDNRRASDLGLAYESGTSTPPSPEPRRDPRRDEPLPRGPQGLADKPKARVQKVIRRDERGLIVSIADVEIPGSEA
jgi:lambda family phage portal protein